MAVILPKSIEQLIKLIHKSAFMDNHLLVKFVRKSDIKEDDLFAFSQFNHSFKESYGRMPIYQTNNFGIYVMSWIPGDFTAIHSHGHSEWGIVQFMGKATHRIYSAKENFIQLTQKATIPKGSIEPMCGNFIHAMGNLTQKPFLSLHIYGSNTYNGPVTEDSKIFEIERKRIRTSQGPAFLNMDKKYLKPGIEKLETNNNTLEDYTKITQKFYNRLNIREIA